MPSARAQVVLDVAGEAGGALGDELALHRRRRSPCRPAAEPSGALEARVARAAHEGLEGPLAAGLEGRGAARRRAAVGRAARGDRAARRGSAPATGAGRRGARRRAATVVGPERVAGVDRPRAARAAPARGAARRRAAALGLLARGAALPRTPASPRRRRAPSASMMCSCGSCPVWTQKHQLVDARPARSGAISSRTWAGVPIAPRSEPRPLLEDLDAQRRAVGGDGRAREADVVAAGQELVPDRGAPGLVLAEGVVVAERVGRRSARRRCRARSPRPRRRGPSSAARRRSWG